MKRKVKVLMRTPGEEEQYVTVFEWETKKKGFTTDVVGYLVEKFQDPELHPSGYTSRPLDKGDRIELTLLEGGMAGTSVTYEMISPFSYAQL